MAATNELAAALRFGHVTEYNATLHQARVEFPDLGIVSHLLPILTRKVLPLNGEGILRNDDVIPLTVGEHVACIVMGNGAESGVILGCFFDEKNPNPYASSSPA